MPKPKPKHEAPMKREWVDCVNLSVIPKPLWGLVSIAALFAGGRPHAELHQASPLALFTVRWTIQFPSFDRVRQINQKNPYPPYFYLPEYVRRYGPPRPWERTYWFASRHFTWVLTALHILPPHYRHQD